MKPLEFLGDSLECLREFPLEGAQMTKRRFISVWDAIEDSATEAASMKLRAELAIEIVERMRERKLT